MQVKIGLLAFPTVGLERLSRSLSWWVSRSSGLHGGAVVSGLVQVQGHAALFILQQMGKLVSSADSAFCFPSSSKTWRYT